ncbi:MAG TPA: hypothetical protein VF633_08670 [Brevundimonas sp.]|jgi:hypothetical protein
MLSSLLALPGSIIGAGSITLLYLKWRGDLQHPGVLAAAWAGIAASMVLWGAASKPDVGVPFAVGLMMLIALAFVLKGADLRALARFPDARRATSETAVRISWPSAAARTLSAVVAAPVVGMTVGLLVWTHVAGHEANRFICAVVVFLAAFAALQVWGLSALRPWRALALIVLVGVAAAIPVALGL